MRDETIGDFLDRLPDRGAAPRGGGGAALAAAQVAALLAMVARFSTGEEYAEHRATIERIITEADELRAIALRLGEADAEAFAGVASAYRMPKATAAERGEGSEAMGEALEKAEV